MRSLAATGRLSDQTLASGLAFAVTAVVLRSKSKHDTVNSKENNSVVRKMCSYAQNCHELFRDWHFQLCQQIIVSPGKCWGGVCCKPLVSLKRKEEQGPAVLLLSFVPFPVYTCRRQRRRRRRRRGATCGIGV